MPKKCKHEDSLVRDSRPTMYGQRRRRECITCGHRWTTMEIEVDDRAGGDTATTFYINSIKREFCYQLADKLKARGDSYKVES
jgi:hypothetical protein